MQTGIVYTIRRWDNKAPINKDKDKEKGKDMKKNCQIADTYEIAKIVACNLSDELGYGVIYKSDSCYLKKDGTFHFVMRDNDTGLFTNTRDFTANEIAYMADMPRWEIVGIDNGGFDELAILFYEEN